MQDLLSYLPKFIAAYSILFFAAASPGPAVAFLLGVGTAQGRPAALRATLGIACGSVTTNILTLTGVGLVLSQIAWAMTVLKLVGAAYLLWLAWGAFGNAFAAPKIAPQPAQAVRRVFFAGYLMQVSNPKSILFWLAIASVGATEGGGPLVIGAFLLWSFVISFLCHGAWAVALSAAPVRAVYARFRRRVEAALCGFFTFAAFKLATSER